MMAQTPDFKCRSKPSFTPFLSLSLSLSLSQTHTHTHTRARAPDFVVFVCLHLILIFHGHFYTLCFGCQSDGRCCGDAGQ